MSLSVTESGGAEKSAQMSVFVAEVDNRNKNKSGHVPNLGGTAEISNNFRPCRMTGAIFLYRDEAESEAGYDKNLRSL